jgi:hypothetical protein
MDSGGVLGTTHRGLHWRAGQRRREIQENEHFFTATLLTYPSTSTHDSQAPRVMVSTFEQAFLLCCVTTKVGSRTIASRPDRAYEPGPPDGAYEPGSPDGAYDTGSWSWQRI